MVRYGGTEAGLKEIELDEGARVEECMGRAGKGARKICRSPTLAHAGVGGLVAALATRVPGMGIPPARASESADRR